MTKILIADDEVIERTVLEKKLKKHYKEDCLILSAQNGRQILEIYDRDHPQILAAALALFSEEFSYAKSAISVHALDYLLKPCDERELISAVDEAIRLARFRSPQSSAENEESRQAPPAENSPEEQQEEDGQPEKIRAYILQHYMEDIAVKDIAGYLGYSEAYFCKLFKQYFGHSFVSYLTDYRMQIAEELMRTSRLSIKEIGKKVGYPDPNYFTKVFRRVRGVSPSGFRDLEKQ